MIKNVGTRKHNFTLDIGPTARAPRLAVADACAAPPGHRPALLDYRGKVHTDRLPADRSKSGMRGVFVVR